jgi:hypothetical protein
LAQALDGITQVREPVAHIRSQRQINSIFHPCSPEMIVMAEGPASAAQRVPLRWSLGSLTNIR